MSKALADFRRFVLACSLFDADGPGEALQRMGFLQADPIRAPARAQELILRQRVPGYRVGDLNRWYPDADVEEGMLYVYGYMARDDWRLIRPVARARMPALQGAILAHIAEAGPTAPGDLAAVFGKKRATNGWGGVSRATNIALEGLLRRGLLRVAGRDKGIRRYVAAPADEGSLEPRERLRRLILLVARTLAPCSRRTLAWAVARARRKAPRMPDHRPEIAAMIADGTLAHRTVDEETYVWPPDLRPHEQDPHRVRFLAPFDPVVWCRERFERLYGWSYRFEAYTPAAKRVRGYYALPMLYGDSVIGWVNASAAGGRLSVERGFATRQPKGRAFEAAYDGEVARFERFLGLDKAKGTAPA